MNQIDLSCPPQAWPKRFSGISAIGITDLAEGEDKSIWLLFQVEKGNVLSTACTWGFGSVMPEDVAELKPLIFVRADRATWESLAVRDVAQFHMKVQAGQIHMGGDFRLFARNALSLMRSVEMTTLWADIEKIIQFMNQ